MIMKIKLLLTEFKIYDAVKYLSMVLTSLTVGLVMGFCRTNPDPFWWTFLGRGSVPEFSL